MKKVLVLLLFLVICFPQSVFAKKKNAAVPSGSGYIGTLPDPTEGFQKTEMEESTPSFESVDGFNDKYGIKPAPKDNPAFVNIIMKKDKTSQYINDLNDIINITQDLQTSIEDKDDVQKFNAESNFLKINVDYFRDKYKNKAESSYISFKKVMQLNTHVQTVAKLRSDSEVYSPYVTAEHSGNLFSQNNINNQLDYLLDDIKSTLVVLKNAK